MEGENVLFEIHLKQLLFFHLLMVKINLHQNSHILKQYPKTKNQKKVHTQKRKEEPVGDTLQHEKAVVVQDGLTGKSGWYLNKSI